jgi:uncharacterized membrane protein
MSPSEFFYNRFTAPAMVALSGFAGGAVFLPAVLESARVRSPGTLLPAGLAGAVALILLWLALSAVLSGRLTQSTGELMRRTGVIFAVSLAPLISYFPYLVYRTSLDGESVEVPPLGSRPSAIILLIWSILLLAVLLRMILGQGESRLLNRLTRQPAVTLVAMMVVWLFVFFIFDVTKLQYMHVSSVNSAFFSEAMTDVFDSRGFMWSNLLYADGSTIFGVHINAIFFFILPIFRLWPDYRLLLFISDVALVLAAVPAYLIARRHFSTAISLLISAMLLMHPILTAQPGRSDFSELRFVPVLFLFACYFFEKKRPWAFAVVAFFMLTIREDMGLYLAFFGVYALIRHYPWRWIVLPTLAGLGWFVVMGAVLLPHLGAGGKAARAALRYSNLGNSGGEIARTILFRPWKAIGAALSTPSHVGVAYGLLLTYGLGLPLLSGSIIIAIPGISELMFQNTTTLVNFMALPIVPALLFAYINGLYRLDQISQKRWKLKVGKTAALTGVFFFFLSATAFHAWFNPELLQPRYNYDAAREAFNQVPGDASLMMPEFMLVYSRPDQTVRGFHQVEYEIDERNSFQVTEDYVILDRRIPAHAASNRYYQGLQKVTDLLETSADYRKVYSRDDVQLYVKNGHEPAGVLIESGEADASSHPGGTSG